MLTFYQKLADKLNETGSGVSGQPQPAGTKSASFNAAGERTDPPRPGAAAPQPGDPPAIPADSADQTPDGRDPLDVDLFQSEGRMVVFAQLPGVSADHFSATIDAESNTLVIEAEQERPPLPPIDEAQAKGGEDEKGRYVKQEAKWRKMYRKVYLPAPFDAAEAKAFFSRGVLTVLLPAKRPGAGKKLAIQELPDEK